MLIDGIALYQTDVAKIVSKYGIENLCKWERVFQTLSFIDVVCGHGTVVKQSSMKTHAGSFLEAFQQSPCNLDRHGCYELL